MKVAVRDVEEVREAVLTSDRLLPVAGASKPALSAPATADVVELDVSALSGIVEYDPAELTFTAQAGTPIRELEQALSENGQYLPFDPPLRAAGATLGGVVAAGTSGPGAFRRGGVRDFVIGVRFVDGTGRLVRGGGKVVKNAAGFDLPKLLVGSAGRLGVIVELSLKVFPRPRATSTAVFEFEDLAEAVSAVVRLGRSQLAVVALDLAPPGRVLVRVEGSQETLRDRASAVAGASASEFVDGDAEARLWEEAAELAWVPRDGSIVRAALTPSRVAAVDALLREAGAQARYSIGANVGWIAWPRDRGLDSLDAGLRSLRCAAVALTGPPAGRLLGWVDGGAFAERVTRALDPHGRFAGLGA